MLLTTSRSINGSRLVLRIKGGEIDLASAPRLRALLTPDALDGHRHVVLDLRAITFLDSTALGVLVGRLKALRELGGSLALVIDQPRILRIFEITGLDQVFHPCATVDQALQEELSSAQQ